MEMSLGDTKWNLSYLHISVTHFNDPSPHCHPDIYHKLNLSFLFEERVDNSVSSRGGLLQIIENCPITAYLGL